MSAVERMRLNFVNFGIININMGWDRVSCCCGHTQTHGSSFNSTPQIQHLTLPSHLRFHLLQFLLQKQKDLFFIFGEHPSADFFFWVILIFIWSKGGIAEGYWYDLSLALFCYQPSLVRFLLFCLAWSSWIFLDLGLIFSRFSDFCSSGVYGVSKNCIWGFSVL